MRYAIKAACNRLIDDDYEKLKEEVKKWLIDFDSLGLPTETMKILYLLLLHSELEDDDSFSMQMRLGLGRGGGERGSNGD